MYPFTTKSNFAFNQWYIAGWSHEIGRELTPRRILDIPILLYRTEAGDVTAMLDMCPHRRMPLSQGRLEGDVVECRYHGFAFGADGRCVRIPAQDRVPPEFAVRSFPVVQEWEWIWIWMGDPELADRSLIPSRSVANIGEDGWVASVGGMLTVKGRYGIIHENLLDLSHVSFLHSNTIGSAGVIRAKMHMKEVDGHLDVARYVVADTFDGQGLAKAMNMQGLVDRTMVQQFYPPHLHITGSEFTSSMEGGVNPGHKFGSARVIHGLTPETPHTTHYFWGMSRNFRIDDDEMTRVMLGQVQSATLEDVEAFEAIEANLTMDADPRDDLHCRADTAGLRGRLMLERLIAAEEECSALGAEPARTREARAKEGMPRQALAQAE